MKQLELHPRLVSARARLEGAQRDAETATAAVQAQCKHEAVWWIPWRNGMRARRLCMRCRLEEKCQSSWCDEADRNYEKLNAPKVTQQISETEFYSHR